MFSKANLVIFLATIRRAFATALPLLFALDMGCKGFVGGTNPPPGPTISKITDVPALYTAQNTPQTGQGNCSSYFTTPQSQWNVYYQSGSEAQGTVVWPGGVGSPEYNEHYAQTLYYALAPDLPANVQSDAQQAITAWNNVLQNNATAQLLITLAYGSAGSPVTIFPANDSPIALESDGGGESFTQFQTQNPVWTQAVISVTSYGYSDIDYYNLILHEIGHSLGIDHNPYVSSIMYPWELHTCFNAVGASPSAPADTAEIENIYDPTYAFGKKKCGPCNPCDVKQLTRQPIIPSCNQPRAVSFSKPRVPISLFPGPLRPDAFGAPRIQTNGYQDALSRAIQANNRMFG